MVLLMYGYCDECGQPTKYDRHSHTPVICEECEERKAKEALHVFMDERKQACIEDRVEWVERWIYEHMNEPHDNPLELIR